MAVHTNGMRSLRQSCSKLFLGKGRGIVYSRCFQNHHKYAFIIATVLMPLQWYLNIFRYIRAIQRNLIYSVAYQTAAKRPCPSLAWLTIKRVQMSNCIFHHLNFSAFDDTADAMPDEMALWHVRNLFIRSGKRKDICKDHSAVYWLKLNCLFNINVSFFVAKKSNLIEDIKKRRTEQDKTGILGKKNRIGKDRWKWIVIN